LWAFYLASWVSWGAAAAVTEVEASILGKGLGVEHREPLPRIYIELGWRLSGVENLSGNVHVRLTVQQPAGHVGVGGYW